MHLKFVKIMLKVRPHFNGFQWEFHLHFESWSDPVQKSCEDQRIYSSEPPSLIHTVPDIELHVFVNFEPFHNFLTPCEFIQRLTVTKTALI